MGHGYHWGTGHTAPAGDRGQGCALPLPLVPGMSPNTPALLPASRRSCSLVLGADWEMASALNSLTLYSRQDHWQHTVGQNPGRTEAPPCCGFEHVEWAWVRTFPPVLPSRRHFDSLKTSLTPSQCNLSDKSGRTGCWVPALAALILPLGSLCGWEVGPLASKWVGLVWFCLVHRCSWSSHWAILWLSLYQINMGHQLLILWLISQ